MFQDLFIFVLKCQIHQSIISINFAWTTELALNKSLERIQNILQTF